MGISNTISISKTRKITARRKNRSENGKRAVATGSKPHSNGEVFSRSILECIEIASVTVNSKIGKIRAIKNGIKEYNILVRIEISFKLKVWCYSVELLTTTKGKCKFIFWA